METNYIEEEVAGGVPVKMWTRGVPVEDEARRQLTNAARLPIVFKHIAAMPDVHFGIGATVGSVIPTLKAIIPAAVGVDIGCGMMAVQDHADAPKTCPTTWRRCARRSSARCRTAARRARATRAPGARCRARSTRAWAQLEPEFAALCRDYPKLAKTNHIQHLGTLGTGNHFIEVCLDEAGLRLVHAALGLARRGQRHRHDVHRAGQAGRDAQPGATCPTATWPTSRKARSYFGDYVRAVGWAQKFARLNREVMMRRVIEAAKTVIRKSFQSHVEAVNCHHNYVQQERHFGEDVFVTRKGAVSAKAGRARHHPGQHGRAQLHRARQGQPRELRVAARTAPGRTMSRGEAKRRFTLADHRAATEGVECRKDKDVIDETPAAYKDIDAVMAAQQRPGRGRAHAEAGRVREGLTAEEP